MTLVTCSDIVHAVGNIRIIIHQLFDNFFQTCDLQSNVIHMVNRKRKILQIQYKEVRVISTASTESNS